MQEDEILSSSLSSTAILEDSHTKTSFILHQNGPVMTKFLTLIQSAHFMCLNVIVQLIGALLVNSFKEKKKNKNHTASVLYL